MEVQKLNRGAILPHFPQVSIDKFEFQEGISWTSFFLTHYDDETLNELLNGSFFETLGEESSSHILYLHKIVFSLLKYWTTTYNYDNDILEVEEMADKLDQLLQDGRIVLLNVNTPVEFTNDGDSVKITPLSSGSDAGCIMLLIESAKERVLYTGACRLTVGDLKRCSVLHDSDGNIKKIDRLYLDTTNCLEDVKELPSRSAVVKQLAKHILKQTEVDDFRHFEFATCTESRISNLFSVFQMADLTGHDVHVPFELAELMDDLKPTMTASQKPSVRHESTAETRIHYDCAENCGNEDCFPQDSHFLDKYGICKIQLGCELSCLIGSGTSRSYSRPADQIEWTRNKNCVYASRVGSLHGIYSNHLSFNEIGRLLNYLHVELSDVLPLFLREDMSTDDIELGLEYACDANPEPAEVAAEVPSTCFDFTH